MWRSTEWLNWYVESGGMERGVAGRRGPFVWRQNKGISDDKCQACTRSTGFAGKELQVSSRWVVTVIKGRLW